MSTRGSTSWHLAAAPTWAIISPADMPEALPSYCNAARLGVKKKKNSFGMWRPLEIRTTPMWAWLFALAYLLNYSYGLMCFPHTFCHIIFKDSFFENSWSLSSIFQRKYPTIPSSASVCAVFCSNWSSVLILRPGITPYFYKEWLLSLHINLPLGSGQRAHKSVCFFKRGHWSQECSLDA